MKVLTEAMENEIQRLRGARRVFFVEADFGLVAPVRMWSGTPSIIWDNVLWHGVGQVLEIGTISGGTMGRANAVTFRFAPQGRTGQNDIISPFLNSRYVGRAVRVWMGFLDTVGVVIPTPIRLVWGRLSSPEISDERGTDGDNDRHFVVQAANEAEAQNRSQQFKMSQARQQLRDPTDKGLSLMAYVPGREQKWVT